MEQVLFTGFPGFIANELISRVADVGTEVTVLILPSERQKAEAKAAHIQRKTGCPEIRLVEGDITRPGLGLNEEDSRLFETGEWTVWHLAAIYDLAVPKDLAWKVNVGGTKHVNEFVAALPSVKRYMYFSTAYVAGRREGRLYEDELVRPDSFKNYYEETKFEAEVLVEELKSRVPVTIIRPGIVRGNSETGETVKFDGPYFFLNMIDRLRLLPAVPFIGRSESFINVVPVDYILDASVYLSRLPAAAGKTVHLTDPDPHPVEEVYRKMVVEMTGKQPKGRIPRSAAALSLKLPAARKLLRVEAETLDYLSWKASFDTQQAERLLAGSGIRCADFLESMPVMIEFYNLHKDDKNFQITIL